MDSFDDLLSKPVEEIVQALIALREQKRGLEIREDLLKRTLELRVEENPEAAAYFERPGNPATPFGPLRMQIKRLLASYKYRDRAQWIPRDVLELLTAQGATGLTIDNVRVTMRRMAQRDELIEGPGLLFAFPKVSENDVEQLKMPVAGDSEAAESADHEVNVPS